MLNLTIHTTPIAYRDWCPACEVIVLFADHAGLLACPDCGWPVTDFDLEGLEDEPPAVMTQPEPLAETGWAALLALVDQLTKQEVE
jgi:ribosomal protein S27AE